MEKRTVHIINYFESIVKYRLRYIDIGLLGALKPFLYTCNIHKTVFLIEKKNDFGNMRDKIKKEKLIQW